MIHLAMSVPMDSIRDFCRRWRIAKLEVFGSILRDDFGPESDVDFLVTWEEGALWSWGDYLRAGEELATLLGRKVDFIERSAIETSRNWIRREDILGSARVIHAA